MTRVNFDKAMDGCHRYGWLITLVANLVLFSYFIGGMRVEVSSVADRLTRVERVMDQAAANAATAATAAAAAAAASAAAAAAAAAAGNR